MKTHSSIFGISIRRSSKNSFGTSHLYLTIKRFYWNICPVFYWKWLAGLLLKKSIGFYLKSLWAFIKNLFAHLLEDTPLMLEKYVLWLLRENLFWKIMVLSEFFFFDIFPRDPFNFHQSFKSTSDFEKILAELYFQDLTVFLETYLRFLLEDPSGIIWVKNLSDMWPLGTSFGRSVFYFIWRDSLVDYQLRWVFSCATFALLLGNTLAPPLEGPSLLIWTNSLIPLK